MTVILPVPWATKNLSPWRRTGALPSPRAIWGAFIVIEPDWDAFIVIEPNPRTIDSPFGPDRAMPLSVTDNVNRPAGLVMVLLPFILISLLILVHAHAAREARDVLEV
jgi:hypothetical protein